MWSCPQLGTPSCQVVPCAGGNLYPRRQQPARYSIRLAVLHPRPQHLTMVLGYLAEQLTNMARAIMTPASKVVHEYMRNNRGSSTSPQRHIEDPERHSHRDSDAMRTIRSLEERIHRMRQDSQVTQETHIREIRRYQRDRERWSGQRKEMEVERAEITNANRLKDREIAELQRVLQERENQLVERNRSIEEQSRRNAMLQDQIRALTTARNYDAALLETRASELQAAQVYLSKADAFSDADIQEMLDKLNANIFQCAAQISNALAYEAINPAVPEAQDKMDLRQRVTTYIGSCLTHVLETAGDRLEPILIQVAVQSGIAWIAYTSTISWSSGRYASDEVLARICEELTRRGEVVLIDGGRSLSHLCL